MESTEFPASGRVVGDYRLGVVLGRGGMGEVYRARDLRLGRDVAVKALPRDLTADTNARERFVRETRAAARIVHPYVATVFDVVEVESQLFLVMEYIDGERLDDAVEARAPSTQELARIGLEISEALVAIHAAGFVHRDLKPGNIMLTRDGHVKVLDFGVVQRIPAHGLRSDPAGPPTEGSSLTTPGAGVGTVAYMSPEQVRGEEVDPRSDLFSLGIVLYEAITGQHPFMRESTYATASAILHESPGLGPEPRTLTDSGPLRGVVLRLLEKDRAARYQSSSEVAADLGAIARGESLAGTRAERGERRTALRLLLVGAVVVAAIGLPVWMIVKPDPPRGTVVRPALAVLPFQDLTGESDAIDRGAMLADLLAADLSGRAVRALRPDRVEPVLAGLGGSPDWPASGRTAVGKSTPARWIVGGTVYKEGASYHAAVEIGGPGAAGPAGSFRVAAGSITALVDLARPKILAVVDPGTPAGKLGAPGGWAPRADEAGLLYQKARRAVKELRYADAAEHLERALELDPDYLPAAILHARALDAAGYGKRALAAIQQARRIAERGRLAPTSFWSTELDAVDAALVDRLDDAVAARLALAEAQPDDPEAWLALAGAWLAAGKPDQGVAAAEKAAALDGLDPRIPLLQGNLAIRRTAYDEAGVHLDRAERAFAEMGNAVGVAQAWQARGNLDRARSRWSEARESYREAGRRYLDAKFEGGVARARTDEATTDLFLSRLQDAEPLYESATDSAARRGDWRLVIQIANALGATYRTRGDNEAAERRYRKALDECRRLDNDKLALDPLVNLASLLGGTGRPGEAEVLAREALEIAHERGPRGHEVLARVLLADALCQVGRFEDAIQDYEAAAALGESAGIAVDQRFWTLEYMTQALAIVGETERAAESNARALRLAQESGQRSLRAYGLLRRAVISTVLADWDAASKDLDEIESLAGRGDDALGDLIPRIALARGTQAVMSGNSGPAAKLLQAAVDAGQASDAQGVEMPARTWLAILALERGEAERGAREARKVVDGRRATLAERVRGRSVLARCLAASRKYDDARREARAAFDEAAAMGIPLTLAEAAAALVTLPKDHRPPDLDRLRADGQQALARWLERIPPDRRDAVKRRPDLGPVYAALGVP